MIPYQDDCLCDWRTSSCATHGHLQIRHVFVSFVKLSRWLEGFGAVYVDSVGRWRGFAVLVRRQQDPE
jgi:hypothetical protein